MVVMDAWERLEAPVERSPAERAAAQPGVSGIVLARIWKLPTSPPSFVQTSNTEFLSFGILLVIVYYSVLRIAPELSLVN